MDFSTGSKVDVSRVKIINPIYDSKLADGTDFPFTTSTPLYPEWNFAARPHVSSLVSQKVQEALLKMDEYASGECTDATPEIASLAQQALSNGHYARWRSTLSYIQLRLMQEELGVANGEKCVHSTNIAEAVVCPEGFFRKNDHEITSGCAAENLDCYGFQCVCSPCLRAFEVEFLPVSYESSPCAKFDICGEVEQGESIVFHAIDNKRREGITMSVKLIDGKDFQTFVMEQVNGTNHYEFSFDANQREVGITIIQLFVEDEQVLQSPFRFEVVERDCKAATGNVRLQPDRYGNCICSGRNVTIAYRCVAIEVVVGSVLGVFLLVLAIAIKFYVNKKNNEASFWKIHPAEVEFPAEPHCLGSGKYGVVLEAKYRGSAVAVKRVFPGKQRDGSMRDFWSKDSPFASYERANADDSISLHKETASTNDQMLMKVLREEMLVISRLR